MINCSNKMELYKLKLKIKLKIKDRNKKKYSLMAI